MLNSGLRDYWLKQNPYTNRPLAGAQRQIDAYAFQRVLVRHLYNAGVRMMTGTDTPLPVMFPGSSLHLEIAELIGSGIPVYDVLLMATRNAGDFIRERISPATRVGRIAPGYRADVLLVRGSPLDDPTVLQHPDYVFAGGRVVVGK